MPLFKGEGCKSYSGKAINYITDKNKAEIISSQNLNDNKSYSKQFLDTAHLYGKGDKFDERKYYHFKLSCNRADNVSANEHHKYAEEMVKKLFPNYECVIATHTDTETVHSHIIVNAVNFENGRKLHCSDKEYTAMKDLANKIGIEKGFSFTDFRKPSQSKDRITTKEHLIMLKGGTSWKEELREVITEAKSKSTNMTEFEKSLNDYGVTLTRNTDKTIAYLHPQKSKAIRGEKLGLDYTKGEIVNVINQQRGEHTNTEETTELSRGKQLTTNYNRPVINNNGTAINKQNESSGFGIDESGEYQTKNDIGQLHNQLQQIREYDTKYNPKEQRRIAEKNERARQLSEEHSRQLENIKRIAEQQPKIGIKDIDKHR